MNGPRPTHLWACAAALLAVGCDLLAPGAKTLENQIEFVPQAQRSAQMLQRWWPLLMPPAPVTGPAFGALPLDLPATFPAGMTAASDLPLLAVAPDAISCDTGCRLVWNAGDAQPPFRGELKVAADGEIDGGVFATVSDRYGVWQSDLGAGGAVTQTALVQPTLTPVASWQRRCVDGTCTLDVVYRRGIDVTGRFERDGGTVDVTPQDVWTAPLPWAGVPRLVRSSRGPQRVVQAFYANGVSMRVLAEPDGHTWQQLGPGAIAGVGQRTGDVWRLHTVFPTDQALLERALAITAPAPATTAARVELEEVRTPRFGRLRAVAVDLTRSGRIAFLDWRENGWRGTVQIRPAELGWQVDAFWSNAGGELITLNAQVDVTGLWIGDMTGWHRNDEDQPSESAEWTMLPDGTWQANVLFRQVDASLTEVPMFGVPDGASPPLFE